MVLFTSTRASSRRRRTSSESPVDAATARASPGLDAAQSRFRSYQYGSTSSTDVSTSIINALRHSLHKHHEFTIVTPTQAHNCMDSTKSGSSSPHSTRRHDRLALAGTIVSIMIATLPQVHVHCAARIIDTDTLHSGTFRPLALRIEFVSERFQHFRILFGLLEPLAFQEIANFCLDRARVIVRSHKILSSISDTACRHAPPSVSVTNKRHSIRARMQLSAVRFRLTLSLWSTFEPDFTKNSTTASRRLRHASTRAVQPIRLVASI